MRYSRSCGIVGSLVCLLAAVGPYAAGSGSTGAHPGHRENLPEVRGEIVAVADDVLELKIDEGDGSVRRFRIGSGDASIYKAGDRVRGRIARSGAEARLDTIWPDDPVQNAIVGSAKDAFRRDTVSRGSKAFRGIGEVAPDFTLYNERGAVVSLRSYRGRMVVINFIFSRCAMPRMCPAATSRMSMLQTEARKAGVDTLQLLSISFDPDYDTPGILAGYSKNYGVDSDGFSFLTGDGGVVKDVLKQFGVDVRYEGGTFNHTMSTILLDKHGRIVFRRDGSRWEVGDFLDRIVSGAKDN